MRWRHLLPALLLLASPLVQAKLRLCVSDTDDPPWLSGRSGLMVELLDRAAARSGVELELSPLPWPRCLAQLNRGQADAAAAASYVAERTRYAVYPLDQGGRPDPQRRLYSDSYAFYSPRGKPLGWDGHQLTAKTAPLVAMPPGYSIGVLLRQMPLRLVENSKDSGEILHEVARQLVDGAALLVSEANAALAKHPELVEQVVRERPNLQNKPFYLVFAKGFYGAHRAEAERLWHALATVRDSPSFRQHCAKAGVSP